MQINFGKNLKKFVSTEILHLKRIAEFLKKKFAKLIGTKYAIGVNSGTDAI